MRLLDNDDDEIETTYSIAYVPMTYWGLTCIYYTLVLNSWKLNLHPRLKMFYESMNWVNTDILTLKEQHTVSINLKQLS